MSHRNAGKTGTTPREAVSLEAWHDPGHTPAALEAAITLSAEALCAEMAFEKDCLLDEEGPVNILSDLPEGDEDLNGQKSPDNPFTEKSYKDLAASPI